MLGSTRNIRVYAYRAPVDMRLGYNGLYGLVTQELGRNPLSGDIFLFVGRDRKRAKALMWDGTGLCLYSKRLERGRFSLLWAEKGNEGLQLTVSELHLFLEGSRAVGRYALSPPEFQHNIGVRDDVSRSLASSGRRRTSESTGFSSALTHRRPEEIDDIETLRQLVLYYEQENARLLQRIAELIAEIATLTDKKAQDALQAGLDRVRAQLEGLQRKVFGTSSERRRDETREHEKGTGEKPKRSGHGPRSQPKLPVVEEVHHLDDADKMCPACGGELTEMKEQYEESEEIDYIPPKIVLKLHRRQKYRCSCNGCIETALGPVKLIPGGRNSVDFALHLAVSKYVDHLPLERQVRQMERSGLVIDSQTLFDQLYAAAVPLIPTYTAIHAHLMKEPLVFADETPWKLMLAGDTQSLYLWGIGCRHAAFYSLADTRAAYVAGLLLPGYAGLVSADAAGAYGALKDNGGKNSKVKSFTMVKPDGTVETILAVTLSPEPGGFTLLYCWAHVRRRFDACKKNFYKHASEILDLIEELYAVEKEAGKLARERAGPSATKEEVYAHLLDIRRTLRPEKSTPVLEKIDTWLNTPGRALPTSTLGEAIGYAINQWEGLKAFVHHPEAELDNNAAERALRGPVVGRKNHYGSRSTRGLLVASIFYTLFESAKLSGVEPQAYVRRALLAALANPGAVTLPRNESPSA
jgi:transposase